MSIEWHLFEQYSNEGEETQIIRFLLPSHLPLFYNANELLFYIIYIRFLDILVFFPMATKFLKGKYVIEICTNSNAIRYLICIL